MATGAVFKWAEAKQLVTELQENRSIQRLKEQQSQSNDCLCVTRNYSVATSNVE